MPTTVSYPGVYIEELSSGVRTIAGVSTAVTAFVGYFSRGPLNDAVQIFSMSDFERRFGGLRADSEASYAIQQYFLNGGGEAQVVRVASGTPAASSVTLNQGANAVLVVDAANEGEWGDALTVTIDYNTADPLSTTQFNLTVTETNGATEIFRNLVMDPASARYAVSVINNGSSLIMVSLPAIPPAATARPDTGSDPLIGGDDGALPGATELTGSESLKTGMYTLLDVDIFNILCIPDTVRLLDPQASSVASAAEEFCGKKRAFYILDVPQVTDPRDDPDSILAWLNAYSTLRHNNAAVYFPRPQVADSLNESRLRLIPSSGTVAGLYARTDGTRGVWKAPAGTEASLRGVQKLEYKLTDSENGVLNPLGINCLRNFPVYGSVCWGARTLNGADQIASEWKYAPVRRLALYLEESLFRGTQWVVFEPNDEPLWAQIRLNIGAFMNNLFRKGAFQGKTPAEAYFVKCDKETTTQNDINLGIVNIIVGFAPLKPAEFVIIKLQQIAGQIEA